MKNNLIKSTLFVLILLSGFKINAQTSTYTGGIWHFTTPSGFIDIGPQNASYSHIYTDATKPFLFNTDVTLLTGGLRSYGSTNLSLKTGGTSRLTILNSNGFVGIGTTSPTDALHVVGNFRTNGNFNMDANKNFRIGNVYSGTGALSINVGTTNNSYFDINGSLFFRRVNGITNLGATLGLQSDGTVTIGVWEKYDNTVTNTQGHRLMVNGGILCEKIKVIADVPNSDHVFEKEYKLKTLEEIKTYIEANKHLPEVPSAQEFKDNGYNVGEMDDLLLRKVEELTLYVIQLKEEINTLKAGKE